MDIQQLEDDMTKLIEKCSSKGERWEIAERFEVLKSSNSKILQLTNSLSSVVTSWLICHDALKRLKDQFSDVDEKLLQRPNDRGPEETFAMNSFLAGLHQDLVSLESKCDQETRHLGSCRVTVIDSISRCRIDLRSDCAALRRAIDKALATLRTRKERRDKLAASWASFESLREDLVLVLDEMEARLDRTKVDEPSLAGVEDLDRRLGVIKADVGLLGEKYDEVRTLGRSLIASSASSEEDEDEVERVRQALAFIAERWEHVHGAATSMRAAVTSVIIRWKLCDEAERDVGTALENWKHVADRGITAMSGTEVRQLLETFTVGCFYGKYV